MLDFFQVFFVNTIWFPTSGHDHAASISEISVFLELKTYHTHKYLAEKIVFAV
jgi:hypothetical protein